MKKHAPLSAIIALLLLAPSCKKYTECHCYKAGTADSTIYFTGKSLDETKKICTTIQRQNNMDTCESFTSQRK